MAADGFNNAADSGYIIIRGNNKGNVNFPKILMKNMNPIAAGNRWFYPGCGSISLS